MQPGANGQRNSQRRAPSVEQDVRSMQYPPPPPPAPANNTNSYSSSSTGVRSSSGSTKSTSSGKRRDPSQQLSQIEKSVTHLLIATKQLLETLTQWSRQQATEGEVSDVYVRLGYEFNIACRAFTSIGVDISDLGNVPDALRSILEETLSQDPSTGSLERYLPRIRDIIINLLHGLKRKQQKLRAKQQKDGVAPSRTTSVISGGSAGSGDFALSQQEEVGPGQRSFAERTDSFAQQIVPDEPPAIGQVPQRSSSIPQSNGRSYAESTPSRASTVAPSDYSSVRSSRHGLFPPSDPRMSGDTLQNDTIPQLEQESEDVPPDATRHPLQRLSLQDIPKDFPAPPPEPLPKPHDALAALQRGGELERRASRRYSQYQISKHLGASPGGVPMMPPTQNGPLPNRGKDNRDSLNAVRSRSSLVRSNSRASLHRSRSTKLKESSPSRAAAIRRMSEDRSEATETLTKRNASPLPSEEISAKTPIDQESTVKLNATVTGPVDIGALEYMQGVSRDELTPVEPYHLRFAIAEEQKVVPEEDSPKETQFVPDQSPEPGAELTIFLQYKSKIKKHVLPDGADDLTLARLQLAFIEKFAWHTQNNGADLPEIYIQDPVSGVRHELEDLSDIKDRSVLVLNVEALDEIKRHFDGALGGIRQVVESVRAVVETQQSAILQVSQRQEHAAKDMARLASASPTTLSKPSPRVQADGTRNSSANATPQIGEVQTLRRDLAVMRQTLSTFTTGITTSMTTIKEKAVMIKEKVEAASVPATEGDSGRAYVDRGKTTVETNSANLVNRVDDLQDLVEDLRKDVVTRGVRPLPTQLESVTRDITEATTSLRKMKTTIKQEKPIWSKIWEKELEVVCNDRDFLTMQEELIADLEDDLEKATQTFALVEEATKQQHQPSGLGSVSGVTLRSSSRGFQGPDPDIDPREAKNGVLGQVRALQPNHESRLEAIERAEKQRMRGIEEKKRDHAFTKEVAQFVGESKLRKTGGADEVERLRKAKDERNLQGAWTEQADRKAARQREREEEKARKAAEAQAQAEADAGVHPEEGLMSSPPIEQGDNRFESSRVIRSNTEGDQQGQYQGGPHSFDDFAKTGFDPQGGKSEEPPGMYEAQPKSWLPSMFSN